MSLQAEILTALHDAQHRTSSLLDPSAGRMWQEGLVKALSTIVADRTDYGFAARAYRMDCRVPSEQERWLTTLRIRISGVGPYVSHAFVQAHELERWWSSATRASRAGYEPSHLTILSQVRGWYATAELIEPDQEVLSELVPEEIILPKRKGGTTTVYQALFGL